LTQRFVAIAARLVLVVMVAAGGGCASRVSDKPPQVAGIDPSDVQLTDVLLDLDAEIEALEVWLSNYPGHFDSLEERSFVTVRWRNALERAEVLLNVDLQNPELFARVGNLYRQGHNLDVPEAAGSSYSALNQCIMLEHDHVECHFDLARLLLASPPRFATRAEHHLHRVRALIEPDSRPEVEAALAHVYFAQGRRSAALRQIDHYLSLQPEDLKAQRFRNALLIEMQSGR